MQDFTKRYSSYDNIDLFKILAKKSEYQPEAVLAAKAEIDRRQISEEEVDRIQATILKEKEAVENKEKRSQEIKQQIIDTINPVKETAPTVKRVVNGITIVFCGIALFQWYKFFQILFFVWNENLSMLDFGTAFMIIPLLILTPGIILFWKRVKTGWVFMMSYFVFTIVQIIAWFYFTWNLGNNFSDYQLFGAVTPQTAQVLTLIFYGGLIYTICQKNIKDQFQVTAKTMTNALIFSFIFSFFIAIPYLL